MARKRVHFAGNFAGLDPLILDLRDAVRSLSRYPIAAAVAIVSLAAGIGGTTATLIARDVMFFSPPPLYQHPDQLSRVTMATPDRPIAPVPGALVEVWLRQGISLAATVPARAATLRTAERLETVPVRAVTPELFDVVGVQPLLGHTLDGDASGAVLSYRVWQNQFGGRADVVGRTIWIDDRAYTVVGVMPERFWVSAMDSPIWTALDPRTLGAVEGLDVMLRRAPGVTPAAVEARLQVGVEEYLHGLPSAERRRWVRVTDINGTQLGNSISPVVLVLMSACVLLTLLIAVSNVAILMIAQWTTREQEIGIRAALGASRGRVLRLLLTESVLVAIAGGLLGVCAMAALVGLMASRGTGNTGFYDLSIHPSVLLVSAAVTLVAGLFAGIAPALYETRRLQANPLRAVSSDRARQRWRHALVVFEIAVTVALLVVTGAIVDGYRRTLTMDVGFDTHPLLTARIERSGGVHPTEVLDLLRAMPGVDAVAAGTSVPMSASGSRQRISLEAGAAPVSTADLAQVSVNFFDTLKVPMRAGRAFTSADTRVAIVNATLANRLWPHRDPLGATLFTDADARGYQVIGVVADYRDAPLANPTPRLYLPLSLTSTSASTSTAELPQLQVVIRSTGSPVPLVQAVRQRLREAGGGHLAAAAFTFDQIINIAAQEVLVSAFMLVPLIAIGILLTAAGVYSVLSFAVARRGRELAVRLAIGASGRDLARLVVAHSARLVVSGVCIGVGATFWLTRVVQGAGGIFDSPGAGAFVVPIALVLGVGVMATTAPLRRVLRISPASLLRVS